MCGCTNKIQGMRGRKKISGLNTAGLVPAVTVAAGYIAANVANGLLSKVAVLNSPIAKAAVKVGLGLFLAGNKNASLKGIGTGMIVNAAVGVVGKAVPSLGIGSVNGIQGPSMEGLRMQAMANKGVSQLAYE